MPNHVENVVNMQGDEQQIRKMLEAIQNETFGMGTLDFNKITPMPESLMIECGSRTERGVKAYLEFLETYTMSLPALDSLDHLGYVPLESEQAFLQQHSEIQPDEWELGRKAFRNLQRYGATTWYDWSIKNWGTKWNAYGYDAGTDYSERENLRFQTAWSAPHPVLEKLSEMYPNIVFVHQWADEDLGANCGTRTYHDGKMIDEMIPEGVLAMQFALDVWEYNPEDLGLALNKTGTDYISLTEDEYQVIELFGKPALFANERLTDADIPQGLYCYHLRRSDTDDGFASLEQSVTVNHGGSVVTNYPIDFGEKGYLELTEETAPNFTGDELSFAEYMRGEHGQQMGGQSL